jgi:N-acetylglucosamine-6-sulfatase
VTAPARSALRPPGSRAGLGLVMRLWLLLVGGLVVGGCSVTDSGTPSGGDPGRRAANGPNVIVVMTDDQTVEDLKVMRRTRALLGRQGVTFQESYASFPLCCPSRATFLTGQYAHNHGVVDLKPPRGGYGRLDQENSLPAWLSDAGYETIHIGKYLNGYGSQTPPHRPAGWTRWHGLVDPSTYRMWGYRISHQGGVRSHEGEVRSYGRPDQEDPRLYQTDVLTELALEEIRATDKPFFLSLAYLAPHGEGDKVRRQRGVLVRPAPRHAGTFRDKEIPANPARRERDFSDKPPFVTQGGARRLSGESLRRAYQARQESLLAVDEGVARIMALLRKQGQLDNTYVIFTSDNGFFQGEHGRQYGKTLAHRASSRVPLLIRGPGIPKGRVSRQLVANVDLAPTLVKLTQAEPGVEMDGTSLLPYARDPERSSFRVILHESMRRAGRAGPYTGIRTPSTLFIRYRTGDEELYDLRSDPWELESKRGTPELRTTLSEMTHCRGESCRRPSR